MNPLKNRAVLYSALAGFLYGLFCRIAFTFKLGTSMLGVVTIGFVLLVPMVCGFITAFLEARAGRRDARSWLVLPVLTTLALLLASFVLFWEGIICIALMLPIALITAIIGGALGLLFGRRSSRTPLACVAILPFMVAAAENWAGPAAEIRVIESSVDIRASADEVWKQIERVPPIRVDEQRFSWSQRVGFPRPVEATLSHQGVGGVRHATFAGGLLFVETINVWEPQRRLGFDIRADAANIPPTTLDEHVTIGGKYFDTLHGEYMLEPFAGGVVRLHLVSRHRLTSTLNFYARLWTDGIMQDIQQNILYVIRNRCEQPTGATRGG